MKKALARFEEPVYALLRFVTGFMLFWHGVQKIFGAFGKSAIEFGAKPQLWIGGVIELACGVTVALGLFTRPSALLASGTMAVAYFQYHVGSDLSGWQLMPLVNKGELAALYCFVFLFISARGPGKLSLDRRLKLGE
jgi:putative oxidoreductase